MISESTYTEEIHQSAANGCQMINFEQFKAISIWSANVQTKTLADPSSWRRRRNQNKQSHLSSWIIKQRLSNRDSGTLFWKGQKEKDQSGHSWEAAQPSCRLSCLKCHPNSSHLLILPRGQRVVELSRLTLTITSKKVSGRFGGEELWSRRWQKIIEWHNGRCLRQLRIDGNFFRGSLSTPMETGWRSSSRENFALGAPCLQIKKKMEASPSSTARQITTQG